MSSFQLNYIKTTLV